MFYFLGLPSLMEHFFLLGNQCLVIYLIHNFKILYGLLYIIQYVHGYNEYFFAWLKRLITRQGATDSAGLPTRSPTS
jgi:hypothetical protein